MVTAYIERHKLLDIGDTVAFIDDQNAIQTGVVVIQDTDTGITQAAELYAQKHGIALCMCPGDTLADRVTQVLRNSDRVAIIWDCMSADMKYVFGRVTATGLPCQIIQSGGLFEQAQPEQDCQQQSRCRRLGI